MFFGVFAIYTNRLSHPTLISYTWLRLSSALPTTDDAASGFNRKWFDWSVVRIYPHILRLIGRLPDAAAVRGRGVQARGAALHAHVQGGLRGEPLVQRVRRRSQGVRKGAPGTCVRNALQYVWNVTNDITSSYGSSCASNGQGCTQHPRTLQYSERYNIRNYSLTAASVGQAHMGVRAGSPDEALKGYDTIGAYEVLLRFDRFLRREQTTVERFLGPLVKGDSLDAGDLALLAQVRAPLPTASSPNIE
eukprot:8588608-Pyramimonas_sp.AAC.1